MKKFLFCCLLLTVNYLLFAIPVRAQVPEPWIEGDCVVNGVATLQGFECLFANVVRILTPIAVLAVFIMLIVGSLKLLTSGGDPKQTQQAQQTLTYAIFGLVLFVGIWFILQLIKTVTGIDVTIFKIPGS